MAQQVLLDTITIPAAGTFTTPPNPVLGHVTYCLLQAKFLYGAGGTTVKAYVQTSCDGGLTWIDIACFAFALAAATKISKVASTTALTAGTTPVDGALTDNTILDGVLGDSLRVKYIVTGTYTGASSLQIVAEVK